MEKMVDGKTFVRAQTLGSMYDQNSIKVMDDEGNVFRIKAEEILKALQQCTFETEKARVHTYLHVVI